MRTAWYDTQAPAREVLADTCCVHVQSLTISAGSCCPLTGWRQVARDGYAWNARN